MASRALAGWLGVRFDATPLDYFWQYLDPQLLRDDLLASLFYQHSQPPAFNALIGLVLKSGGDFATRFEWLSHAVGLATCLGVYALASRLGMEPRRAGVLAAIYAASPTAVLYEHWLFYTHWVACGLVLGALALHAFLRTGRAPQAALLALCLAAVALSRSLFHLAWLVAVLLPALLLATRGPGAWRRRGLVLAMAPALLLVVFVYAKNAVLFGSPAASTWLGMSLAKVTTHRLDPEQRAAWIEDGTLSPAAAVRPFSPMHRYPPKLVAGEAAGHPALDRPVKPGRHPNFNHRSYVAVSRQSLADALAVVRVAPEVWLASVGLAGLRYAIPPSQYDFVAKNAAAYAPVDRVYQLAGGVPEAWTGHRAPERLGDARYLLRRVRWVYWAIAGFAFGWAIAQMRATRDPALRGTLAYCLGTAVWVGVLANAVELDENQRFAVLVAPIQLAVIGAALDATWRQRSKAPPGREG